LLWNSLVFAPQPAEQVVRILRTPASCHKTIDVRKKGGSELRDGNEVEHNPEGLGRLAGSSVKLRNTGQQRDLPKLCGRSSTFLSRQTRTPPSLSQIHDNTNYDFKLELPSWKQDIKKS
jgi:hypothetical protein